MKINILNIEGNSCGEIELSDKVLIPLKQELITDVVLQELANERSGTASTKTKGDVSGGGRKPWKQKGTGRARQGSTRNPHWRGGGVAFGPHPKDYHYSINDKMKKIAFKSALSEKIRSNQVVVLDKLELDKIKTKTLVGILEKLEVLGTALLILNKKDDVIIKSARNIDGVKLVPLSQMSVHDIANYEKIIITKDAMSQLTTRLSS